MADDSLLGQLAEEFTQKVREGAHPEIEEFARSHPELADRIRELFPTLIFLERVLPRDRASHRRI
jgi:eukaryotic-like serine/threonine-protein kinase